MEIKITIEDVDEKQMKAMSNLGHVLSVLFGDANVEETVPVEGEQEPTPQTKSNKKWPCAWCGRKFKLPAQLNKHLGFCSKNPNATKFNKTQTKTCVECGTTETPQWRKVSGVDGELCNSCGMKAYRLQQKEKKEMNPFVARAKETPKQKPRIISVKKPVVVPTYTKMDHTELCHAVASYVAGNNGVVMEADKLASVLIASLSKRFKFQSEQHKEASERVLVSTIGLKFRQIEESLREKKLSRVTFLLDTKGGDYKLMILNQGGSFNIDDIREMLL